MTNEEAAKWLENLKKNIGETHTSHLWHYEQALDEIIVILRNQPRWIPCSERLPKDDTLMLVNYYDPRENAMDIWIGWHEMENVWYIDGSAHSREYGSEVYAWMPLPEPYERGETE